MNPAGETEGRDLRFAREVVRELGPLLRREPPGSDHDLSLSAGKLRVRIEDVLLDVVPEEPRVVVLFRDLSKPGCLFRFRMEALEPSASDPEIRTTVVWANFLEAIEGGPGTRGGSPAKTTDVPGGPGLQPPEGAPEL